MSHLLNLLHACLVALVLFRALDAVRARLEQRDLDSLRDVFESYDLDRSGEIDASELSAALGVDEMQALGLIASVDHDASGTLSLDEFVFLMANTSVDADAEAAFDTVIILFF